MNSKTGVLEGFYSLIPDNRKAVVRHWRKEYLKKHIKNLDDIIIEKTANDFFHEITSRIQNEGMEWGRYKRNYFGSTIYNEYRKVFKNTLEYEKDAREYTDQWNDYYIYSMEVLIKEDKWLRAINEMQLYTFDELVDEKMEIKGLSREDAIWEINQRGPKELL